MNRIIAFVFFLNIFFSVYSQNQGLLWRITRSDMKDTSYLFGTNHSVEKKYQIPNECKLHIQNSKICYFETITDNDFNFLRIRGLFRIMFNPGMKKIEKFITSTYSDSLKKYYLVDNNVNIFNYNFYSRFRPILMSDFLYEKIVDKKNVNEKINNYYRLDDTLGYISKFTYHNKIRSLENISDIGKLFKSIPIKHEAYVFFDEIFRVKDTTSSIDLYYSGESNDFFMKKIDEMTLSEKVVNYQLLVQRNLNWLNKIEKSINKKPTFIAVGLGHVLPDNYGLVDLLRAKGYTVECILKEYK
jgi:uncharacterized protein YbaP (TraB family)